MSAVAQYYYDAIIAGLVYNGLVHACDWLPTAVSALTGGSSVGAAETLPLDGLDLWAALLGAAFSCSYQLMITTYSISRYRYCTVHICQAAVAAMAAMPESLAAAAAAAAAAASGRGGLDLEVMFMRLPIPILLRNIAQSAIISLPPLLSLPLARVHIVLCARIEFSGGSCDP